MASNIESVIGRVVSVNRSDKKGTSKAPVSEIAIDEHGVVGDAHAGDWHRQVSLLAMESVEAFSVDAGRSFACGEFAENITTRGIDLLSTAVLDRFTVGAVELEVTQLGKKCHGGGCAIFQQVGQCVMPRDGIFCRVIHGGTVKADAPISWIPRPFKVRVITLSDRAFRGVYEDQSGPRLVAILSGFFKNRRWHPRIETALLPDDADRLRAALASARGEGVDVVFTTGGTGIGSRDVTPDVVSAIADKEIPGIMEYIRVTYGAHNPNALLSRSVAAILGQMQVYTLPGSVKAVEEYMGEILKTLEHAVYMLHGLDGH